jgi:hypothetical protein
MVRQQCTPRKGKNTGGTGPAGPGCRLRDSVRAYITRASAATTPSMLRLLSAATQMRPESTP